MKPLTCHHEPQILQNARQVSLSAGAREHLAVCEVCTTALQVDQLLFADAGRIPSLDKLPDPALVWWRSRQQARLRRAERVTMPIQIAERLALALGALGLIIGLSLTWPLLGATFDQWVAGWARGLSQALPLGGSSLILALTGSLFLLVGFGLYSQWAER